jgi:chromosome partitioning protein
VWELGKVAELVELARAERDGLAAFTVLNQADPGVLSADNDQAGRLAQEVAAFEFLDAPVRRRKSIANASAMGLHVSELKGSERDAKAVAEINRFQNVLMRAMSKHLAGTIT